MLFFCAIFCIQHKVCLQFVCAIATGNNKLIQVISQSIMFHNSEQPTTATPCADSPTTVLALKKALLNEEGRSMWSNVEMFHQIEAGHTHTWTGKGDGTHNGGFEETSTHK